MLTVLFADLCGSTPLIAEMDTDEAADAINELLELMISPILNQGGQINRLFGDEILAFFGATETQEDNAERAISAAMDLRDALKRHDRSVTIGINQGMVYLGAVGSLAYSEQSAIRAPINLAARLRESALPGQILVGPAIYRQTRGLFTVKPRQLTLQGVGNPVTAYEITGRAERPVKRRGSGQTTALIGRAEELAELLSQWRQAITGQGQVALIQGEAGIGKSRLLQAFLEATDLSADREYPSPAGASSASALLLDGYCRETTRRTGFNLFRDILLRLLNAKTNEGETLSTRLKTTLQELCTAGDLTPEQMEESGPILGHLLDASFGTEWDNRLRTIDPEQLSFRTRNALVDFFSALTQRRPVALVCEDVHWADPLSLMTLNLMGERLRDLPLMLLVTRRTDPTGAHQPPDVFQRPPERFAEITLRPLSPQDSALLTDELATDAPLPAALRDALVYRSAGNPFFLEELIHHTRESGSTAGKAGGLPETPETVQSVLLSRVDRLEPETRQVLYHAAIVGQRVPRPILAQMMEPDEVARAWPELLSKGFLVPDFDGNEETALFRHALIQETVYRRLLRRNRAVLHGKAGAAFETLYPERLTEYCKQIAYHYDHTDQHNKAIHYQLKAGEKARQTYLNDEAIRYFQRAIERLDGWPAESDPVIAGTRQSQRLDALTELGRTYHGTGAMEKAETAFRQAIESRKAVNGDAKPLISLLYWLGNTLWWQNRTEESIHVGKEGLALLNNEEETPERALLLITLAGGYWKQQAHDAWLDCVGTLANFLQCLPYSEELRLGYVHAILASIEHRNIEEAFSWLDALEKNASERGDVRGEQEAFCYRAYLQLITGDLKGSIPHYRQGIACGLRIGDYKNVLTNLHNLSNACLAFGDVESAKNHVSQAMELADRTGLGGSNWLISVSKGLLSLYEQEEGQLEETIKWTELAIAQHQRDNRTAPSLINLGWLYLACGAKDKALTVFQEGLQLSPMDSTNAVSALTGIERSFGSGAQYAEWLKNRVNTEQCPDRNVPLEPCLTPNRSDNQFKQAMFQDEFKEQLLPGWKWYDPYGDCALRINAGIEIVVANGRDLFQANLSAPRLVRSVSGRFAAQTLCARDSMTRLSCGGIVLWQDPQTHFRIDVGRWGWGSLLFSACINGRDQLISRGYLTSELILLRMERENHQLNAFYSDNEITWQTLGKVNWIGQDQLQVGLFGIGIQVVGGTVGTLPPDRYVYPLAHQHQHAVRFKSFQVYSADSPTL